MFLHTPVLVVLTTFIPFSSATPTPFTKRYTGATIRSYRTNTCLTLPSGVTPSNGALLTVGDCATATKWDINPGSGSVIITGTNYALDAGIDPHNSVPAKVWQSYPGLTQQTWYLTGDNRIAITGGNQCLDQGGSGPQTYQCTTGNTNQSEPPSLLYLRFLADDTPTVWYVQPGGSTPSSSSQPPASSTSSQPPASSSAPPGNQKYTLRWKGNFALCASVQGRIASGGIVELQPCEFTSVSPRQNWIFFPGGNIQLAETGLGAFCLDGGALQNGVTMRIRPCVNGASQQNWNYPNSYPLGPGNGIFQTGNNQCLDVNNQGNTQLQTWACSVPDPQQQFIFIPV